jgi:hypothetical protein
VVLVVACSDDSLWVDIVSVHESGALTAWIDEFGRSISWISLSCLEYSPYRLSERDIILVRTRTSRRA